MNIFCKVFGHKPPVYAKKGWYSPGEEYGIVIRPYTDNVNRTHAEVHGECARCGKTFKVARIHLPRETSNG